MDDTFIYTEPNFQGTMIKLKNYESLYEQQTIKSASVPMGHTLTFFEDSNFKKVILQLGLSIICDKRPNLLVTFQSYVLQNYNSPKYAIGTVSNPNDVVIFYNEPFFKGEVIFTAYTNLNFQNVDMARVKSIYIPNGLYIDFYERSLVLYHSMLYIIESNKTFTSIETFKVLLAYPSQTKTCSEYKLSPFIKFISSKPFIISVGVVGALCLFFLIFLFKDKILSFINELELESLFVTLLDKPYKFWIFISVTAVFLSSILFIFIAPYIFNDRYYMTFNDSLKKNYSRLNSIKTVVFLTLHFILYFLFCVLVLYNRIPLTFPLLVICTIVWFFWLLLFLYFMPCETPLGLVNFGKLYKPVNNSTHTVTTFLAIGDPQEFGPNFNRYKNNKLAVKNMNKFINEMYPALKQSNMTDIMGCLIPGDCTQTGQDGRLFTNNYLGDYELNYGLGDMSDLNIPVYECTGNHDWDTTLEASKTDKLYFKTCAAVNMINRRNNYRKIIMQDKEGNYMWKFNQLYLIAVNCWPAPENIRLVAGKPKGSLKFLQRALNTLKTEDRFIILTHHIPIPIFYGFKNITFKPPDFYLQHPTLINTPCEQLLTILGDKKDKLLAVVLGHLHLDSYWSTITDDGKRVIIPPAPANNIYNGSFVMFSYDDTNKKLSAIQIENDGKIYSIF